MENDKNPVEILETKLEEANAELLMLRDKFKKERENSDYLRNTLIKKDAHIEMAFMFIDTLLNKIGTHHE